MRIEITAGGETFPCAPSMGAMLRFKQETGKEVTEIDAGSVSELCAYLYCCTVSACAREKREFPYKLMEFADMVSPDDMAEWQRVISGEAPEEPDGEDEKKSRPESLTC